MTSDRYGLYKTGLGSQGWDTLLSGNVDILDDVIETRDIKEAGEALSAYEAVYIKSDGKFWLAQADGSAQPTFGVMIEAAAVGEEKRAQTRGIVTNASWTWTVGEYVYLDDTTPGALTQTIPAAYGEVVGVAISATELYVMPTILALRPYEIAGTFNGILSNSLKLVRLPITTAFKFPAAMDGSSFYAATRATAQAVFSLKKNGVQFGTCTFEPDFTIDAAAAVDKGSGLVGIPATAHGLSTGQKIVLSGTTNYDGTYELDATSSTNEMVITATYAAETFGGTEAVEMYWGFFAAASATTFAVDDILTMEGPSSADTTLADLGFVLAGNRSGV